MPKQKKCEVQLYTRFGFESEPTEFDSISEGIRWAKENGSWRYVVFVDGYPMNEAGKIQKYKMREEAVDLLNLHDAANIETA